MRRQLGNLVEVFTEPTEYIRQTHRHEKSGGHLRIDGAQVVTTHGGGIAQ
ncbi:Hypothetical protein DIP0560 [Corynebacterium diphtheriae]|uniref:Uncharacterized protein n=1 Tax=Corynebacterium diphtheriae (strain ATCC 700971 / NCTC 13129 / Biotype gravis) TaxID=257309 RepID=Q6NJ53_CORDI|nr:Hypothetical protein DIP0560 [Corynebacterium diphtheriae]